MQTQARRQARDAQGLALTYVMSSSVSRAPVVMPMIWVQFCMMTGARRSAKVPVGLLHTGRLSWLGELHLLEAGEVSSRGSDRLGCIPCDKLNVSSTETGAVRTSQPELTLCVGTDWSVGRTSHALF